MAALSTAVGGRLQALGAPGLAVVVWGYSRLGLRPDRRWLLALKAAADASLGGDDAQALASYVAGVLAQQSRQAFAGGGAAPVRARRRDSYTADGEG